MKLINAPIIGLLDVGPRVGVAEPLQLEQIYDSHRTSSPLDVRCQLLNSKCSSLAKLISHDSFCKTSHWEMSFKYFIEENKFNF